MKKLLFISFFVLPFLCLSQTYTHPTSTLQNTYLGACMVNTCSGSYYDDGGAGGNYSTPNPGFVTRTYRTFCPDRVGECVRFTFNSTDIASTVMGMAVSCFDYFTIINSATQVPQSGILCGSVTGTATSTDPSGCLGLWFYENGTAADGNGAGWDISISCVPCAGGPNGTDNNDCVNNQGICSSAPIAANSNGPGLESTCVDCIVSENYTTWYHVIIQSGGTFEMTILGNGGHDYDFAVFQSNDCAALGAPVRCSYAAGGNTGFISGQTGTSEDVTGDSWLAPITGTNAGDEFFILINDWSGTGTGYTLNWGGTASLDCAVLPVELIDFVGRPYEGYIELNWNTATELSLERYDIEKMIDGKWTKILESNPAGSNSFYSTTDNNPKRGANIYRLKSLDLNGEYAYSDVISVHYNKEIFDVTVTPDKVMIDATDVPIETIELFNVLGQQVNNLPLNILDEGTKYEIDLDQLPTNTYILRLNGIEGKMFVKYY